MIDSIYYYRVWKHRIFPTVIFLDLEIIKNKKINVNHLFDDENGLLFLFQDEFFKLYKLSRTENITIPVGNFPPVTIKNNFIFITIFKTKKYNHLKKVFKKSFKK